MAMVGPLPQPVGASRRAAPSAGPAWLAVALIPLFFVLAFAAGEGIVSALGWTSGDAPFWVAFLGDVLALLVAVVPCVGAVVLGRRAHREGVRNAIVPAVIGGLVGVLWVVMTLVTEIGDALR